MKSKLTEAAMTPKPTRKKPKCKFRFAGYVLRMPNGAFHAATNSNKKDFCGMNLPWSIQAEVRARAKPVKIYVRTK